MCVADLVVGLRCFRLSRTLGLPICGLPPPLSVESSSKPPVPPVLFVSMPFGIGRFFWMMTLSGEHEWCSFSQQFYWSA